MSEVVVGGMERGVVLERQEGCEEQDEPER